MNNNDVILKKMEKLINTSSTTVTALAMLKSIDRTIHYRRMYAISLLANIVMLNLYWFKL